MMHLSIFIGVDDGVPKASISEVNTINAISRWFREIKGIDYNQVRTFYFGVGHNMWDDRLAG